MRRMILGLALFSAALFLSGCSECFYDLVGEHVKSAHQDGAAVGGVRPLHATDSGTQQGLSPSLVSEFRIEKEWDASYAAHILGGLRFEDAKRLAWPIFFEVQGGLTHYPGENIFTLHPNFGFLIPLSNPNHQVFVRVGLPVYFFSGSTEVGTEFSVGLNVKHPGSQHK